MTNDTPENQKREVSRMSASRRRALKAGAGAVLVPTIMTITARSAHAADYTETAYRYGTMKGCVRVPVTDWDVDPSLRDLFDMFLGDGEFSGFSAPWDEDLLGLRRTYFSFKFGSYFSDGIDLALPGGTAKRNLVPEDWMQIAPPPPPDPQP